MNDYLPVAIQAAIKASEEILKVYDSDITVELKADQSPLTEADKQSHNVIRDVLSQSGIPLLCEEGKHTPYKNRKHWHRFWLIDPLDGTKEFIKRNGEFTVNIALVESGLPVLGVVYLPVGRTLYFGSAETGTYKIEITANESLPDDLQELMNKAEKLGGNELTDKYTIVVSRSHLSHETKKFIEEKGKQYGDVEIVSAGSSLKLCMVAEGMVHVYPRLASTMEWDIAAGHAVAKFAGCRVYDFNTKRELHYNKEDLHNPWFVVERG